MKGARIMKKHEILLNPVGWVGGTLSGGLGCQEDKRSGLLQLFLAQCRSALLCRHENAMSDFKESFKEKTSPQPCLVAGIKRVSVLCFAKQLRPLPAIRSPKLREEAQSLKKDRVINSCVSTVKNLFSYSPINLFTSKKLAFTLAEVLITLAIIGVVAAMTMPSLIAKYKEQVLVNQVKRTYSEMQNALRLYAAKNNCDNIVCISDVKQTSAELADKLFAQFSGAQKCPGNYNSQRNVCKSVGVKSSVPYYANGVTAVSDTFTPNFITASGAAYRLLQYSACPTTFTQTKKDENGYDILDENNKPVTITYTSNTCIIIYFDANGTNKGPNQFGADVYRFDLLYDGKLKDTYSMIKPVLTEGKLIYTPYNLGEPKK